MLFLEMPVKIFVIVILLLVSRSAFAQKLDALLTGNWFEVYKKRGTYYLPLEIQFNADKSARFINRYPEQSYKLTSNITGDSCLVLSNGEKYKILFLNERLLKLKKDARKAKSITLKKAARVNK